MKQLNEARNLEEGVVEAKHEVEIVCGACQDPISTREEVFGACTSCGAAWEPIQNVNVFVTSVPAFATTFI